MSYRKIFSVINEHTVSTVIARYALSVATSCRAELVLYVAHSNESNEAIRHETDRHAEHLMTIASALGIAVTRITEIGNIVTLLPKRVHAENADLVFYPLSPYKRYGADQQRHTVRRLMRTIKPDLVVMRAITMAKPHPGRILVPLGKVVSNKERRLMFVAELATSYQAQVTLYHLTATSDVHGMPDDITRFGKQLRGQNITVLERKGVGRLYRAITVEAITHHNDLIVLGASTHGMVRRLFFGDPIGAIMHKPPCNTILFRPGS
jgi:nucleotide-binding universal stress UspA family protein